MGTVRKAVVVTVMLVLSVYFVAGLVGVLPAQVDYIKQGVENNQEALTFNTNVQTEIIDWQELSGFPNSQGSIMGSITYDDCMYVAAVKTGAQFTIWQMNESGAWDNKYSGQLGSGSVAIWDAKFVEYEDADGEDTLYLVLSSADSYVPLTGIFGSYDGNTWTNHDGNAKFLPDITDYTTDAFVKKGDNLYFGCHQKQFPYNEYLTKMYRWSGNTWTGWTQIYSNSYAKISAMEVFIAPLPNTYEAVYFALTGDNYLYDYAGIYYLTQSETVVGAIGFQTLYEKEISDMIVYKDSLFIGTIRGSLYNYSRTPAPAGFIYQYVSPFSSPYYVVQQFGIYNDFLYMGSNLNDNDGDIYKMMSRTYDNDAWQKDYETGQGVVYSFCEFEGKFYATTGAGGKIFVYEELFSYTNPNIEHTPVKVGYLNIPTKITARVNDIDGIDDVILSYEVEGQILRVRPMNLVGGTADKVGDLFVNGTYSAEIPQESSPTTITYFITATDVDGHTTTTDTYTITIQGEKTLTFFGIDYRVLYLVAIALTLGTGFYAYGRDKTGRWND